MKNILLFALFLLPLFTYAQSINLNIGEHLYNRVQQVIPIEDDGWLVVADVSNVEDGYEIRPRLLKVSSQNTIEWSVTLPESYFDYGVIALRYDSALQQCYLIHRRFECDLIQPDVIYTYDLDGNLLWSEEPEALFLINPSNAGSTVSLVPGEGLFLLSSDGGSAFDFLLFRNASGTVTREYPIEESPISGVYHWRPDTLLLTRNNRLFYATYDEESIDFFSDQELPSGNTDLIHVLNENVIYAKTDNTLTRYDYDTSNSIFVADTTVVISPGNTPYVLSFDNDAIFAMGEQRILTYTHDLRERTERAFSIPGTTLAGAVSNNQQLVAYGITTSTDFSTELYPREGFLYDLSEEPPLLRDLHLTHLSSSGIIRTLIPEENVTISIFDSIRVSVYNAGLDTISEVQVKIQKRSASFICPGYVGLNQLFQDIQLLPGDSISLFVGSLSGYNIFGTELCAWVGTEAGPVETDYTNNSSCINVDIINAVNAPTALTPLNVYPNPTAGTFHFSNTEQWEHYQLYDARGQTVQRAPLPPGVTTVQLDLTKLPTGLYHLVLNGGSGKALARVVKK